MTASEVIAASVVQAASASATGAGISSGVWSFVGGLIGAAVAVGLAIAQQRAQSRRELIKSATDSASSHMANVAFDKYVEFCESYSEASGRAFETLLRHGPTAKVIDDANELHRLRLKWTLWITPDVEVELKTFEQAFREIGASAWYVEATIGQEDQRDTRSEHIDRMYKQLAEVLGFSEWDGKKISNELAQTSLNALLRKVLGTEHFDVLRRAVVSRAVKEFEAV